MIRKNDLAPENFYHIYNRGVDKRKIFLSDWDYVRFMVLLYLCNSNNPVRIVDLLPQGRSLWNLFDVERGETLVDIGAFCLMPNHFHLLLYEKQENGISTFMKKLGTAYAMYLNKQNDRSGILFQGRFKSELVKTDEQLKYLFSYIHLNPVKLIEPKWKEKGIKDRAGVEKFLEDYKWFSYNFYIGRQKNERILHTGSFPEYFSDTREFKDFINDWLNYKDNWSHEDGPSGI